MKIEQVKPAMSTRQPVQYAGADYYITACIMRLVNGEWRYSLELHDLRANSVTIARIEEVKIERVIK